MDPYLSGKNGFLSYDTYGFLVEITKEDVEQQGITMSLSFQQDTLSARAVIESFVVNGKPVMQVSAASEVLLNNTPFYAESGGQIGDHGFLYLTEGEGKRAVVEIKDVQKSLGNIFVDKSRHHQRRVLELCKKVEAAVDAKLRQRAKLSISISVPDKFKAQLSDSMASL